MAKKALIVTNLVGFVNFIWNDFDLLKDKGYEVHFAANSSTINDIKTLEELKELENRNIKFFPLNFDSKSLFTKKNLAAYKQIKRIIKSQQYDLVHCHTPIVGLLTRIATRRLRKHGTTVIYTTHGFSFTHLSTKKEWWIYYYCEKFVSGFTDVIITINREDFKNAQSMHCKNVKYINGVGVNTAKFLNVIADRKQYRESIGVSNNDIMILSVGELSIRKNHEIIIKALSLLENKDHYAYVICGRGVGSAGTEMHLKGLANELGINLHLLGHRLDIPEIVKCADIGAIPSIREGLGLAGIECLSSGIPLVGSDVQGIRDYISNGVDGYLCNPFSAEKFADAIKKLSDQVVRENMKENCYMIAKKFDVSVSHKQMREIYDSVLKGEKGYE